MKITFKRATFIGAVISLGLSKVFDSQVNHDALYNHPFLLVSMILLTLYFIKAVDDDLFRPLREARAREVADLKKRIAILEDARGAELNRKFHAEKQKE